MPKSKNRKNHKKKSRNYTMQLKAARKKAQEEFLKQIREQQNERINSAEEHQTGEIVENENIDVGIEDMDIEVDKSLLGVSTQENDRSNDSNTPSDDITKND